MEPLFSAKDDLFRLLVDSVQDYAIFLLDTKGRVASWNAGAQRIKGYLADEIIGRSLETFYPEADVRAGKCARELETALREGRVEDEGWRLRKDGSRFWANVVITRLDDPRGEHVGFAKVTRDLTDRRAAEQERLRLAQSQEALRLRDEFLSIASHELKTPLTALKLQAQSLLLHRSTLAPKVVAKLERIEGATRRLTVLVETLLDVSRIATGRFALQRGRVDFGTIVREAIERLDARIEAVHGRVRIKLPEAPLMGDWDPLRLEQVVTNLVDNALKYAVGNPVDLTAIGDPERVTLLIEDRGPGIRAEDRERIFQRFERAASLDHFGGLGLGLYVSRQIVDAHGGSIATRDREGGGATFVVTLPRKPGGSEG